jgi:hypothetical protein
MSKKTCKTCNKLRSDFRTCEPYPGDIWETRTRKRSTSIFQSCGWAYRPYILNLTKTPIVICFIILFLLTIMAVIFSQM